MNAKSHILKIFAALITISLYFGARADITTGLQGYWTFDAGSGSTAADSTANGNTGTLTSFADTGFTTMWTMNAWSTNAIIFNQNGETTNYVNVPNSTSMNAGTTAKQWTLAAWVKPSVGGGSQTANAGIITKGKLGLEVYALYMSGGKFHNRFRNTAGTGTEDVASTTTPNANQWYHVVATVLEPKGTATAEAIVYVNGVRESGADANTFTTVFSSAEPLIIGSREDASGNVTLPFQGIIDDVRVYSRALTASDVYQLYTNNPPVTANIVTQPRSVNCYSNDNAVFSVTVDSKTILPLNYQWWFTNGGVGTLISLTTNSSSLNNTLKLANVTNGNAGSYTVVISNAVSVVVTSAPAVLTVRSLPAPDTTSGLAGWWKMDDASGSSTAADSSSNGNAGALTNFADTSFTTMWGPGTIGGALSINQNGENANVVAIPGIGSSAPAVLDFSASPVFTFSAWVKAPVQTSGAIVAKGTGGGGEQYCVEISGGNYRMFVRDSNAVSFVASSAIPPNTVWQHVAAVVNVTNGFMNLYVNGALVASGLAPGSLQTNSHEVSIGNRQSAAASYNIPFIGAVDDVRIYSRDLTSADVYALYAQSAFPLIVSQYPVTYTNLYTLYAGSSPAFNLNVTGLNPLSYQWYTNGVAVPGGTNAGYRPPGLATGGLTNYCLVTNSVGSATSFVWTASVISAPTAPYPQSVRGLGPVAYLRLNEPDDGSNDGNPGALAHDYVGGNDGLFNNVNLGLPGYSPATDPATTAAQFGNFSSPDSDVTQIAGIDFSGPTNTSHAFSIAAWVNGAPSMVNGAGIVTKGYGNGGEQFDLDVFGNAFRFFVRDAAGGVHGPTSTVHADGNWHHVVGVCDEPNGKVTLFVDGVQAGQSSIGTTAGIINAGTNLISIGARKSSISVTSYDLQFQGYINDVAIFNYALSAAQVQSNFLAAGIAPIITQEPPPTIAVLEGGTLTVSAAAIGTGSLAYRWQDTAGSPLMVGQTNATLVITNVPASLDGDSLSLNVTNIYGTTNSDSVVVSVVIGPPELIASNLPPTLLLPAGKTYTYSVQLSGSLPFSYQWYANNIPLNGQTGSTFSVTAGQVGSTNFSVTVTNIHGSLTASSLLTIIPLPADTYGTNILGLHPVGYWPLQETNLPAPVAMETNLGTLGRLGNAYYAITTGSQSQVGFGQGGALGAVGDSDTAIQFNGPSGTNYAFVPRATPAVTLKAPLSLEAWVNSSSLTFSDIVGQGSVTGLNGSPNLAGIRLCYGGNASGGPSLQLFVGTGNGATRPGVATPGNSLPVNQWHHCVATYDSTNALLYVDGVLLLNSTNLSGASAAAIDTWSPLTIGDGLWQASGSGPTRAYTGLLDEVAIYTNILTGTQVTNHYAAGTSTGNYAPTVLGDSPLLYYRMDSAGYVTPDPNQNPPAINYGSAPPNGAYPGAVVPGEVAGAPIVGLATNLAAPINGIISCVDAGNDPAFNPTNHQPFSALLWFKSNPSDGRVQTLVSHGVNNWALNLDGTTGRLVWNLFNGGQVTSTNILNDGMWHNVAGVYDGTISSLYVDGVLNSSTTASGALSGEANAELFLGGNSDFTLVGNNQRYFAGALSHVALFTNALSSTQVQHLYGVAVTVQVPTISLSRSGNNLVITYTGTLLSATNANGTYTPVMGANSPYVVAPTAARTFYRSRNP